MCGELLGGTLAHHACLFEWPDVSLSDAWSWGADDDPEGAQNYRQSDSSGAASSLGLVDSEGSTYLYAGGHRLVASRGHGAELSLAVTVQLDAPVLIDTLL